jgi:hypothetical protein
MSSLPQAGTAALLQALAPHLDDEFINQLFPTQRGRGRRRLFLPNQLFRVSLLALLTPAHSFNLLVKLLAENRSWRNFALLPNKRILPDAKMLHQFRDRLDLIKLRAINRHLIIPFLENWNPARKPLAIMDSTDLPAATHSFKKKPRALLSFGRGDWSTHRQEWPKSVVHRLSKTHAAFVASSAHGVHFTGSLGDLGGPG